MSDELDDELEDDDLYFYDRLANEPLFDREIDITVNFGDGREYGTLFYSPTLESVCMKIPAPRSIRSRYIRCKSCGFTAHESPRWSRWDMTEIDSQTYKAIPVKCKVCGSTDWDKEAEGPRYTPASREWGDIMVQYGWYLEWGMKSAAFLEPDLQPLYDIIEYDEAGKRALEEYISNRYCYWWG